MLEFFIGIILGMLITDIMFAWHFGVIEHMVQKAKLRYKLYRARR